MPDGAKRSTQRIRHSRSPRGKATAICIVGVEGHMFRGDARPAWRRRRASGRRRSARARASARSAQRLSRRAGRADPACAPAYCGEVLYCAPACCTALQHGGCEADGKTRPSCVRGCVHASSQVACLRDVLGGGSGGARADCVATCCTARQTLITTCSKSGAERGP
jgi:hypothetical protein